MNGSTENEGRVEVCFNGQWGTVSLCGFGVFDGQVVCRQLGYPNSESTYSKMRMHALVSYELTYNRYC